MVGYAYLFRFRESGISTATIFAKTHDPMKKILFYLMALLLISCGGTAKIFKAGAVLQSDYMQVLPFNYDHNFALVQVVINDKNYQFLLDTGAPTVISSAIFKDLNLKPKTFVNVSDSQGQTNAQALVVVPEIKLGNLIYNNIGAVVADLNDIFEYKCIGIDGIIGANQMAKSFWKFDYVNKEVTITDNFKNYDLTAYADSLLFSVSNQKTPYTHGWVNGEVASFMFDTGATGFIDYHDKNDVLKNQKAFTRYGSSSVGLYGAVDTVTTRTLKIDSLRFGSVKLAKQAIDVEQDNLIGNRFMNHYDMVINWQSQKIYLKPIKAFEQKPVESFGFSLRMKNNEATVVNIIKELPTDLQLGDILVAINDKDLRNLTTQSACEQYFNIDLTALETINITYLRDGKEYHTRLEKKVLPE